MSRRRGPRRLSATPHDSSFARTSSPVGALNVAFHSSAEGREKARLVEPAPRPTLERCKIKTNPRGRRSCSNRCREGTSRAQHSRAPAGLWLLNQRDLMVDSPVQRRTRRRVPRCPLNAVSLRCCRIIVDGAAVAAWLREMRRLREIKSPGTEGNLPGLNAVTLGGTCSGTVFLTAMSEKQRQQRHELQFARGCCFQATLETHLYGSRPPAARNAPLAAPGWRAGQPWDNMKVLVPPFGLGGQGGRGRDGTRQRVSLMRTHDGGLTFIG
jgi:hypothetical protein